MRKKQFAAIFAAMLAATVMGQGLSAMFPTYIRRLGGDASLIGYFSSLQTLAVVVGIILGGWIADRFQARTQALIFSGLGAIATPLLIGWGGNLWHLIVWGTLLWFFGGVAVAENNVLAGLTSRDLDRGKVFGLLAVTGGLGQLIGGSLFGFVVSRWDYAGVYAAAALVGVAWTLPGFFVDNPILPRPPARAEVARAAPVELATLLVILSAACAAAVLSGIHLGSYILMDQRGLGGAAIASTLAVGGAVSIPVSLLLASLADRLPRRLLLAAASALAMVGLAILGPASTLQPFLIVSSLAAIVNSAQFLAKAIVTDVSTKERLGMSLSVLNTMGRIGNIIASAATGVAIASFGANTFVTLGLLVPLAGILLLIPLPRSTGHAARALRLR
jgi:ENTS family enterobactin (siderophore) exporter